MWEKLGKEARTLARKNQLSSNKDRCDICGAALDDDSLVQEFPDGSVVALCVQCASEAAPEDEADERQDLESDDATVEWAGPHDDNPTAPAPPSFEAEVFGAEDLEPHDPATPSPQAGAEAPGPETPENGATRAEAELAAWASASSEHPVVSEDDSDPGETSNQEELEEATLQLVAAIAEADMQEDERSQPDVDQEQPSPPADAAVETQAAKEEIIDRTKELLVPVTDLLGLQTEMQSALAKLSSTLEHFMTDMQASEQKTSAVNERVQQLEDELESTRERLRAAESLLPESAAAAMAAATATRDADLLSREPDEDASTKAGAALPSVPPPLPGSQSAPPPIPPVPPIPPKTGASKGATSGPPPLGNVGAAAGTALGAAAGAAGAALGTAAGAMVPPPLPGLAAGAAAAAGAAVKPPSLGGTKPAKASASPPSLPSTSSTGTPGTSPAAEQELPSEDVPEEASSADSGADIETDIDAGADATSADEPLIAPSPSLPAETEATAPSTAAAAGPVAGAAAAMQKLLRSRKGQQQPEPEPEPETEPEPEEIPGLTFTINEVQVAQRYFNESEFVTKLKEISRSIGKSQANVSRTSPGAPEAAVTVFWDIVWYQYIVDLRKELPEGTKRVVLMQEGMDLAELEPRFTEKNATVDDHGRLDASELEVRLLSDPDALISDDEASTPETRLAEDATEEIWDQRSAPEFRWD